jgi:hypothetical protein
MVMMMYSLILRDWEKGGEVGVDPTGCLRLLCPRPYQVRELMPLTGGYKSGCKGGCKEQADEA